jgi:hypothetical protein
MKLLFLLFLLSYCHCLNYIFPRTGRYGENKLTVYSNRKSEHDILYLRDCKTNFLFDQEYLVDNITFYFNGKVCPVLEHHTNAILRFFSPEKITLVYNINNVLIRETGIIDYNIIDIVCDFLDILRYICCFIIIKFYLIFYVWIDDILISFR